MAAPRAGPVRGSHVDLRPARIKRYGTTDRLLGRPADRTGVSSGDDEQGCDDDGCRRAYDCGTYVVGRMFGPNGRPVGRCPECEDGVVFQHMVSRSESVSVQGQARVGASGGDPTAETADTTVACADSRYGEGCGAAWFGTEDRPAVNRYVEDAREAFDPDGDVDVTDVRWVPSPTGVVETLVSRYGHAADLLDVPCPDCGDGPVRLHTRQRGLRLMLGASFSGTRSKDYGPNGDFAGCSGCGQLWKNESRVREAVAENRRTARTLRHARARGAEAEAVEADAGGAAAGDRGPGVTDAVAARRGAERERAWRGAYEREHGEEAASDGERER
jgi:hypothetical protein